MDNTIALTGHELHTLATLSEAGSATKSAEMLGLPGGDEAAGAGIYGLTTLLARELGKVSEDGTFTPSGPAAHVAVAFAKAQRWMRVAVLGSDTVSVHVAVASEQASVVFRGRELGIYEASPIDSRADVKDLGIALVRDAVHALPAPLLCSVQVDSDDGRRVEASLNVTEEGPWQVAGLATETHAGEVPRDVAPGRGLDEWVSLLQSRDA